MASSDLGTVGPYELLLQLAKGGMAEVFIARRAPVAEAESGGAGAAAAAGGAGLEREPLVAVKRIRADLQYESSYAEMLFDEAGIASRVASPHFVPVLDYGLDERGAPYIVMELVVGVTLKHLTRASEALGVGDAIELIAQAAEGLHAAHEARDSAGELLQVIHRDISPSNVLVAVDGRASICDLGLAYALRRTTRTKTGMVKGKLSYFSPEQAHAWPLDRRSDVFSLGVVAWEVLAGRRLFGGSSMVSTLHAVLQREVPPLSNEREGVGQAVSAAVARALERDRDARWPTAADFARALRAAAEREGHAASRAAVGARVAEVLPPPLKPLAPSYGPGGPRVTKETIAALPSLCAAGAAGEGDAGGILPGAPRRPSRG
ncbi:serine/threonine-protein kinase [Sorangium sp. So ce1000]|uniref:serine/threonine-protein kinase n=1 Tax=Sorangium sp. So ce1000 TaxID=3133325 RepID=UPI003F63FFF6